MTDQNTTPVSEAPGDGSALRVIVVGAPGSGRSSLLGALGQVSRSQGRLVDGQLKTLSQGLAELADGISHADTLLLTIGASADAGRLRIDSQELSRFLRLLEQERSARAEVGGLPVFLVLTRCDLLAEPTAPRAIWIERIEERTRQVSEAFREVLGRSTAASVLFGRVNLRIWATAISRPALADEPAKPGEPYQIIELCRSVTDLAANFRFRRRQSSARLLGTVLAALGLAAGMLALVLFLVIHRSQEDPRVRELLTKVESYRMREAMTPSNRLRGNLQLHIGELADLQNDPDFSRLPKASREYVASRLREFQEYRTYQDRVLTLPSVTDVHNEKELESLEQKLKELTLPPEHTTDWSQTEAALQGAQQLEGIKALRSAVSAEQEQYRKLVRRGEDLWTFADQKDTGPVPWSGWNKRVQGLIEEGDDLQHRLGERVPGSEITYETVLRFDSVAALRGEWQGVRERLQRLRRLSAALGLGAAQAGRAPLDIQNGFALPEAATREQNLRRAYPQFQEEFTLVDLPEAILSEIRQAAQTRYHYLVSAGRDLVQKRFREISQGAAESYENWRQLRPWLENPPELRSWRVLATVLARLQTPDAEDPVVALATFLKQEQFELRFNRLTLEVPTERRIQPAGRLVLHHGKNGAANTTDLSFDPVGEGRADASGLVTRYALKPVSGTSLAYHPGDGLRAELPVRSADGSESVLSWTPVRSQVYQFEALAAPPRLRPKDQANSEGEVMERIVLQVSPEGGFPKVPDLLPPVDSRITGGRGD